MLCSHGMVEMLFGMLETVGSPDVLGALFS